MPARHRFPSFAFTCVLLGAGCSFGGADPPAVTTTISDSAGVQLVRNEGDPARLDSMVVQAVEIMRIGVVDGEEPYQFHFLVGAAVTDDGRWFVVNGGTNSIRVFNDAGGFLREFAGTGDGPAEFRSVSHVWVRGNTVVAWGNDKVAVFDTLGAFRTSWSTNRPMPASFSRGELRGSARLIVVGFDSIGWLGTIERVDRSRKYEAGRQYRDTVEYMRLDIMTGTPTGEVAHREPDLIKRFGIATPDEGGWAQRLWDTTALTVTGPDGSNHATDGARYVIDVRSPEGKLVRRISRAHDPVRVTPAAVDAYRSRMRAHLDSARTRRFPGEHERLQRRYLEEIPALGHSPTLQAIGMLMVLEDSSLWVLRTDLDVDLAEVAFERAKNPSVYFIEAPRRWDRFDADGRYLGGVEIPAGTYIFKYGPRMMWGVRTDSLDVEYLVKLALPEQGPDGESGRRR